ncbi:MAG: transglutaminase-like cysteine peptidase, partial [Sulfurimonadaceae bacterium]|nr:transglutaminase-like cysteine peptidase [Sulfurimonadaceae bacterium]
DFKVSPKDIVQMEREYNIYAKNRLLALLEMMNKIKDKTELENLNYVNDFFNNVPYYTDAEIWGVSDYWATRWELIGKDKADCEDYVIAKYFTLKELGVSPNKLRMTYVKSIKFNASHMVLTYYENSNSIPLVLDNYNFKIFPASQRKDLIHIFSFNGDDLLTAKRIQIGKISPAVSKQHRAWDELIIKK